MDLDQIFTSKNISQSSKNLYKRNLLALNDNQPIKSLTFLKNMDQITEKLEKYKPNTRRSYYIAIVSFLRCLKDIAPKKVGKLYDKYYAILEVLNKELKDNSELKPKEKENWVTPAEIEQIYSNLALIIPIAESKKKLTAHQFKDLQKLLVLALYTKTPPRRNKDYQQMYVTKNGNKELLTKANILNLKNRQFQFSQYKTAGSYNVQTMDINDEIWAVLQLYLKHHPLKGSKEPYKLLVDAEGNPLENNNDMTRILYKIFGKKVGSSMLRKVYLTSKYGNIVDQLEADVEAMGTSTETAQMNYIKKDD